MSPVSALPKLRALSRAERGALFRATVALAIMRLGVRALPFRLVARAVGLREGRSADVADAATEAHAAQVGRAVSSAAGHAPWQSTCLMQALAAAALLRARGVGSTLYLGVAKDGDAPHGMAAHAWLRCGAVVLTGAAERDRFTPITTLATLR